jgi:hypothetical protein
VVGERTTCSASRPTHKINMYDRKAICDTSSDARDANDVTTAALMKIHSPVISENLHLNRHQQRCELLRHV